MTLSVVLVGADVKLVGNVMLSGDVEDEDEGEDVPLLLVLLEEEEPPPKKPPNTMMDEEAKR